jgi:hypothetical protein
MEIVVVFRYPDIADCESEQATFALAALEESITAAGIDCDSWHIEEVFSTAKEVE